MAKSKVLLESTDSWDLIDLPVENVKLKTLMPEYDIMASDRTNAIVAGDKIYGIVGNQYTLIPNSLIRRSLDEVVGDYKLKALYNSRGEYSMIIRLPASRYEIGTREDSIEKSLIIGNSINGRSHLTVQGNVVSTSTDEVRDRGLKVSFYREICTNGLMGYSDQFMGVDEYLDWLLLGQPHNYNKVQKITVSEDDGRDVIETEKEEIFQKTFKHKMLDVEIFEANLKSLLRKFMSTKDSLTLKVYERMQQRSIRKTDASEILIDAGLPKQLVQLALDTLDAERSALGTEFNAWLLYNSANSALFSNKSGLSFDKRYEFDERLFHGINKSLLA